jgi:hypothetical protein
MTGNGKHTTYKNGDDWGMVNMTLFVLTCFNHITSDVTDKIEKTYNIQGRR